MGFLELAAALKFFRAGELVLSAQPSFLHLRLGAGHLDCPETVVWPYLLQIYRLPATTHHSRA